jgi:hypothetical protein
MSMLMNSENLSILSTTSPYNICTSGGRDSSAVVEKHDDPISVEADREWNFRFSIF